MSKIVTPFGIELTVENVDPLDREDLNGPGVTLTTYVKKTDGFKKYTVIMSRANAKQLRDELTEWLRSEDAD